MISDEVGVKHQTIQPEPQPLDSLLSQNVPSVIEGPHMLSAPQQYQKKNSQSQKKKYSSRMRQLAPHVTAISQTYQYRSGDSPKIQSARTRNNIASQSCRARKKLYMQLLQKQITTLELQLHKTTNQIQMLRTQIFNALMHTDQVNTKNAEMQSHVIKKLKSLISSYSQQEPSSKRTIQTQLNICLDSCLYRIGASGSERKAILDILYKGMINRNLPNIYRYILWSAANKTHLFRKMNKSQRSCQNQSREAWWNEVKDVGEEVILNHQAFLEEKGEPLGIKARQILRCSRQILHQKQEIENYGHGYDTMLKTFREILTPVQFAELFLFVESSVHKRQLQLFDDEDKINEITYLQGKGKSAKSVSEELRKQDRVRRHRECSADNPDELEEHIIQETSGRKRHKPNEP